MRVTRPLSGFQRRRAIRPGLVRRWHEATRQRNLHEQPAGSGTATVVTRLVQMEVVPGAPRDNTRRMLEALGRARADGVGLVVFPELAVPGCLLGDLWDQPAFLRECEACGEEVRAASRDLVVVFGNVAIDWKRRNEDGRVRKYNAPSSPRTAVGWSGGHRTVYGGQDTGRQRAR